MPRFTVLTIHPEIVAGPLGCSMIGRAVQKKVLVIDVVDIREYASDRHRTVDDSPYGGGAGMVMRVDVVANALEAMRQPQSHVILTSPAGRVFRQVDAERLSQYEHLIFLCGHYEGIDARVEGLVDEELSLGDFVVTGGELAAVAMVDAVSRLIPGVLGNVSSPLEESFTSGLLEYPQYTRPQVWGDEEVPDILLSGHHEKIRLWRQEQSKARTRTRRPDLWEAHRKRFQVDEEVPEQ
ncbi:MAG: tRNA (guanosine(37)-N1)-methyltransferase TrmD [Proteobacteria bacterium]|jgi:tRNA (guanine37-N1)-methyltransferase|nr:tRNA (guanosine(37)-N1)-methyltransferase TrmD [Pseudomonadota bacterium]